jgi:hypothetical protein
MNKRIMGRLAFAFLLILGGVGASNAANLEVTLIDGNTQLPVAEANVEIFLSYGVLTAQTDADGTVIFDDVYGRGFWVEVNGERLPDFYYTESSPVEIEVISDGGAQ